MIVVDADEVPEALSDGVAVIDRPDVGDTDGLPGLLMLTVPDVDPDAVNVALTEAAALTVAYCDEFFDTVSDGVGVLEAATLLLTDAERDGEPKTLALIDGLAAFVKMLAVALGDGDANVSCVSAGGAVQPSPGW